MFLLYSALDENFSWYLDKNIKTFTDGTADVDDGDFVESNIMRCKYRNILTHLLTNLC